MQTSLKNGLLNIFLLGALLLLGIAVKPAFAEVIDRIQINQAGDEAEIKIRFVTRIQYVRQAMLKNGDVRIYFNLLEIDAADPRLVWQRRDSPPSNIVPHFTVTYPEIDSSLTINFGRFVDYYIRPGNDGRSISIFTPIVKQPGQASAPLAALPAPSLTGPSGAQKPAVSRSAAEMESAELEARQLMGNAIIALKNNSTREVIDILKKLLDLPPNQQSQTAQLMLGQAHEKLEEFAKARAEYYMYVTRYPKAANLNRVQESLARMVMKVFEAEKSVPEKMAIEDMMSFSGGFSQNYSRGLLHTDSTALPSGVLTSSNSSDQTQLLSSLDLTGWKRTETTETRLVFRDTFTANYIPGIGSNNFLNAAYIEQGASDQSYLYGLGRQTGASGGVPSRFDGAWLSRNLSPAWRVNGTLGKPVAAPGSTAEPKAFAALSVDLSRLPGQWSGNTYLIGQRVGGILDRRAAGMETHYFDTSSNHMGLLEYDTLFKKVNAGLIQGNWTSAEGSNYTMLIDHRRNLQATNALLLQPAQSIAGLLNSGASVHTILADALKASPIFNQLMFGVTQPYSSRLKYGGDIRVINTTSYEAYDALINAITPFPGSSTYIYSAQLVGNNLLFNNDLGVASASYTNANTYKAKTLTFSQVATIRQNWHLNIALQYYIENNVLTGYQRRISPSFNVSYRLNQSLNFEVGGGLAQTHTSSPTQENNIRRKYFNLGYRWDFQ